MTKIPVIQVDAFTRQRFGGNPAAVCLLDAWLPDEEMQSIAAEMNLAETAFLVRQDVGEYNLRWMTPLIEVDLCGHATLASAHALWTRWNESAEVIRFSTRSGELQAVRKDDSIVLDFPATPAVAAEAPDGLLESLGVRSPRFCGSNASDWLIVLGSEDEVRGLRPDFGKLRAIECRGVIVTALANAGAEYDFVSRFFAPAAGIDEDPVTGSAHCCLAPYWCDKLDRNQLAGFQASTRGGHVGVKLAGDRVKLCGGAVTVMRGELV